MAWNAKTGLGIGEKNTPAFGRKWSPACSGALILIVQHRRD
jgi:hypothetical protein